MLKAEPASARALADAIVKNTYRTLMTRGMKGCYVYCTDAPPATYLRSRLQSGKPALPAVDAADNEKAVAAAKGRWCKTSVPQVKAVTVSRCIKHRSHTGTFRPVAASRE